jgi:TP901 family phage tail tape measure protein
VNYTLMALLGAKDIGLRATMMRASHDVDHFGKRVDSTNKGISKFGAGLKAAFLGLAVAAGAFFLHGIGQAVQFEAAMRNVNSISGLSEQSLAGLSSQVLQLSTVMPQSAQTLAQGLYDIASSGFQGAQGMEILSVSAKAASAGLTTTDVSARAIVASLNAYGLSAREAGDVSDILFQTVNLGVVSFEELASELGDVVGGAAAAGVALDEVGAAVAAMTLSGLSAAESTTSLNRLIQALIDPSDALGAAFTNLGHESGKAALDTLGLHGTMEQLRMATGGNIETLLQLFPEIRAARGAFALMAADGQNYANTFAGIADEQNRAGATQRAFNEQMKSLDNQWKLFLNNVNAAAIKLGTALIPALKSGLSQVREFGRGLGDFMQSLATAAGPMIRSVVQAFQQLARLAGQVYDAIQPVAAVLAGAFAGAAILGLRGLAEALAAVAGVLADHPALIQAVAFALGAVLLSKLLTTAAAAAKFAVQFRTLLIMEQLGPILANLGGRPQAFGSAVYAVFSMGNLKNLQGFRTAFAGLGTAMARMAPAAAIAGIFGIIATIERAKSAAQEMRDELEAGIDTSSVENYSRTLGSFIGETTTQIAALEPQIEGAGNRIQRFGESLRGAATLGLVDFGDEALEARESINQLDEALAEAETNLSVMEHDLATVGNALGLTREEVSAFFDELEYDPAAGEQFDVMTTQIRELIAAASGGSQAHEQLTEGFGTVADITSSATDRLDAFKQSLDALIGTMLGAFDAETAYAQSITDLTTALTDNGVTLDAWTESGRANRDALSGAVQAAVDYASEVATSTGSLRQGADALGLYRQQLIDTMVQQGFSRGEAEEYIATLGLTPENLETVIELAGQGEATEALGQVFDAITALDLEVANPRVELDDLPFMHDAAAVGEFLVQVGMAAPEARVLLNDAQFVPTAAQVSAWSQAYDDSTPRAIALLNIIDPMNRFGTLSAAAAGWDAQAPAATANLHDNATSALVNINAGLDRINGRTVTSYVHVVATGPAAASIASGKRYRMGGAWQAQTGLSWEAGVLKSPTIFAGERETGGEAFIPRLGNTARSLSILQQAASWYGANVVPQNRPVMGVSGGTSYTFAPVVSVTVRAEAGVDRDRLAKVLTKAVDGALDAKMDQLRKEVRAR